MTTWADLLSSIRTDLKDTGSTKRWNDDALLLWTRDAIIDYSMYFPKINNRVKIAMTGSQGPLPEDCLEVINVECPQDRYLEPRLSRPGCRYTSSSVPTTYYVDGGYLYLNSIPQDDVLLTYGGYHDLPEDEGDEISVPVTDLELIRLYVRAKAFEQIRSQQANLDRFKPAGDRTDNPLAPEYRNLMRDYQAKIAERTRGGTIWLYRLGRGR